MSGSACIVGVGAVGGWLASLLDAAGWEVRLLARGAALEAIRADGLRVAGPDGERVVRGPASDDPGELGPVDYVILAVKGHDLPDLLPRLVPLVGPETAVVTAMNGLQWWFTDGLPGPLDGAVLPAVDLEGALRRMLPVDQVIGSVVHASALAEAPGRVRLIAADKLILGEATGRGAFLSRAAGEVALEGSEGVSRSYEPPLSAPPTSPPQAGEKRTSERVELLADALRIGVAVEVSPDIRLDIWRKLWGNMSMNPLSALARASTGRLLDDPETRALAGGMMTEMAAIGAPLGLDLGMTPEERMAVTRKLGDFKTSTQRDMEAGRPLELSNLLTVLVQMADRLGQPAPLIRAVHGLARQLDRSLSGQQN